MTINSRLTVVIGLEDGPDSVEDRIFDVGSSPTLNLIDVLTALARGDESGRVMMMLDENDATAASGTVTMDASEGSDGDTITVCGVVFTARTTPSADPRLGEFKLDAASDNNTASYFSAAVNAHFMFKGLLAATTSTNVSTLTLSLGGAYGLFATLATDNASLATLSGANFTSGDEDGTLQHNLEIDPHVNNG